MSLASIHYLISKHGRYWNGRAPDEDCWSPGGGVRFHFETSARAVIEGLFKNDPEITIERDE